MKFKKLDYYGTNVIEGKYEDWPCQSCGMTVSGQLKRKPTSAGKGLRTVIGTFTETDTPTLKIKSIQTKAGPLTIISKHLP